MRRQVMLVGTLVLSLWNVWSFAGEHGIAKPKAQMVRDNARAGGTNCPDWIAGRPETDPIECWAPMITYREETALLDGDTPAYTMRVVILVESVHTFDTRAEVMTYSQDVLAQRGFWVRDIQRCDNPEEYCVFVPPSVIERIQPRQIIDH
jgi:hypothetical protein